MLRARWSAQPFALRGAFGVAATIAALALPLGFTSYWRGEFTLMLAFALANLGFQLIVGWSGQLALANAAFFGLGAYATTILPTKLSKVAGYTAEGAEIRKQVWSGAVPFLVGLVVVPLVCAGIGYLLGLPAVRLKGFYLAIATLAFGGMLIKLFREAKDLTGGGGGLQVGVFRLFGWDKQLSTYYLSLALFVVSCVSVGRLVRTRFGRTLLAVRDIDIAASSLGINVARYRLTAFAISAGMAALGGAMWAQSTTFVAPDAFGSGLLNFMLIMIIVGGLGSRAGALIGAVFYELIYQLFPKLSQFKTSPLQGTFRNLAFGLALMLCVGLLPGGLISIPERLRGLGRERTAESNPDGAT